ncbi:MAG: hypothetical protein OEL55_01640 [Desulfobulbaceae bacterium]|nr:hypothetical protein [Desulfobulbaceae bacterium]
MNDLVIVGPAMAGNEKQGLCQEIFMALVSMKAVCFFIVDKDISRALLIFFSQELYWPPNRLQVLAKCRAMVASR